MTNTPDERPRERRFIAGITLALIGLALFWLNITEGTSDTIIMVLIGAAFLAGYFARRGYGLLIPGCILLGLGLGDLAATTWWGGEFRQLGLGLGFIAIYVIDRLYSGVTAWWPLIPGILLTLGALSAEVYSIRNAVEKGWPLIFVVIGLAIMTGFGGRFDRQSRRDRRRQRRDRHSVDDPPGSPPQGPHPGGPPGGPSQDPPQSPHTGV